MNPRLQPPTGGPSGLVRHNNVFHNSDSLCSHMTGPLPPFHHVAPDCFLQRLRVPPLFFSHLDVTSLVVYVHQLSVYLYFIHVLLMYRSSLKLICFLVVSDRDAATGPETLMNGAILDFQHAPWRGSSDGVIFYFHVLRRCCWYSVSPNVVL